MRNLPAAGFVVTDWLLVLMMAACIATDIKSRRIYNKILILFLIAGLGANYAAGGWPCLLESLKGFLTGLALLIIPFARGGIGAGDVKLLAVIGAMKGPAFVLYTCLAGAVAGGVIALLVLIKHRRLLAVLAKCLAFVPGLPGRCGARFRAGGSRAGEEAKPVYIPYSMAIGAGVAASYGAGLQSLLR
jgi:prepilin peptidase CpaA